MAIALVQPQFGPTSTQNLQFLMFLTIFAILAMAGALRADPLPWDIARAYSHFIPHVLAL